MTFRKIHYGINILPLLPFLISCSGAGSSGNEHREQTSTPGLEEASPTGIPVTLSEKEKSEGWELLFDGENLQKWKGMRSDSFPSDVWVIEDEALVLAQRGGDIVTREKYGGFELAWEFKLTEGANSGIKYFVDTLVHQTTGEKVINGPEFQLIDDFNHSEIKDDPNGLSSTAALYLIYPPENKTLNPADQWNHARIIAKGNQVEHWLNGTKVISYERGSQDFMDKMASTKFRDYPEYGQVAEGHILLTDHEDKVFFKNIRIRRL